MTEDTPIPVINVDDVYERPYVMRRLGDEGLNTVVTIPPLVIAKHAKRHGLTPQQFIAQFRAVATFNGFEGVLYRFEKIPAKPTDHDQEHTTD